MKRIALCFLVLIQCLLGAMFSLTVARPVQAGQKSRENLMVVIRESTGADRTRDAFQPMGKVKGKLADGHEIELELAWWNFIGDLSIRFVFDGEQTMENATPADLKALGVENVEDALSLALTNLKREYGEPTAKPWREGLMEINGKSPDFDSSYFLDRAFWKALLAQHPEGVIVAVPKRGGLLYAPLSDTTAVEGLKRGIGALYASSGRQRVSSALFLFSHDGWSLFQAPTRQGD